MLFEIERERWSRPLALAAAILLVGACAPQVKQAANLQSPSPTASPSLSPAPTPTAPLQASDSGFPVGEVGVSTGSYGLQATGGVHPYSWTVGSGALPTGVTLASDGSISGTPSHAATFAFSIRVTDAKGATASLAGSVLIRPHLTATLLPACAAACSVEIGCVTVCGGFGTVGGGVGPYTYSFLGQLPAGTSGSTTALTLTGTFGGVPGRLQFTGEVTDGLGVTAAVSPTYNLLQHTSLSDGRCPIGLRSVSCTATLTYTGGTTGRLPTVKDIGWSGSSPCSAFAPGPCAPPAGFAVTYQPGSVTITLTYGHLYNVASGRMTLQIADQSLCAQSVNCSNTATLTVQ